LLPARTSLSKLHEDTLDFEPPGRLRNELAGRLVTLLAVRFDEAQEPAGQWTIPKGTGADDAGARASFTAEAIACPNNFAERFR
jgi:hypothetical protein